MADHIGKEIRAWRESAGMSGVDLARKLGITSQRLSNWENERGTPSLRFIDALHRLGFRGGGMGTQERRTPSVSPGTVKIFVDLLYDCDQDPDLRASARRELYRLFELSDN